MPEVTLTVKNKEGLHGRPLAHFIETAKQFKAKVLVSKGGKTGNTNSILSLLALGIFKDSVITISAEGEDAPKALKALQALIEANFGEPL